MSKFVVLGCVTSDSIFVFYGTVGVGSNMGGRDHNGKDKKTKEEDANS
jgi:hypothetical protein